MGKTYNINKTRRYLTYTLHRYGGLKKYLKFLSKYCVGTYIADLYFLDMYGYMPKGLYLKLVIPKVDTVAQYTIESLIRHKSICEHYFLKESSPVEFNNYMVVFDMDKYTRCIKPFVMGKYNKIYTISDINKLKIPQYDVLGKSDIYRTLTFNPANVTEEDKKVEQFYLRERFGDDITESIIDKTGQLDFPPIMRDEIHMFEELGHKFDLSSNYTPQDILNLYEIKKESSFDKNSEKEVVE